MTPPPTKIFISIKYKRSSKNKKIGSLAAIAEVCFRPIALRPAFSGSLPLSIFVNDVIRQKIKGKNY